MTGPIVTFPDSHDQIVPVPPLPVSTARKVDSGICSAVVGGAVAAGLPAALTGPAHDLCVKLIAEARSLGYRKAKDVANFVAQGVKQQYSKFMAHKKGGAKISVGKSMKTISDTPTSSRVSMARVTAPVAVTRKINRRSKPRMRVAGDSIVIAHSEMINSILSGTPSGNVTPYNCVGFRCNPGVSNVFPWLSSVAVNYEKYRFRKLEFTIVPLVSTAYSGRIGVGFDYDSSDAAPGSRSEFYALSVHAENMPWEAAAIKVKCGSQFLFTGTHTAADNKLIDQGQVILMSDSISNGGTISAAIALYDVIVDYEVELIEPQQALFSTQAFAAPVNTNFIVGNNIGSGADLTLVGGPSVVESAKVTSSSVLTFSLPAGAYSVSAFMSWSSGAPGVTPAFTGGSTKLNTTINGSTAQIVGVISTNTDTNLTITVSTVSWTANVTRFDLLIGRVPMVVYNNYVG